MSAEAILLYGSKARGDGDPTSDTDLIAVTENGKPQKSYDRAGVSLHAYPKSWLLDEAIKGSLFLMHVTFEGIALFDPNHFHEELWDKFTPRLSYEKELEAGARIVAAFTRMRRENFSASMLRRYFWGLRTALMASAADHGAPAFSAQSLEMHSGITGLARHIQGRETATFEECCAIGPAAIAELGPFARDILASDVQDNLQRLFNFSGVAGATAGEIIYGF